MRCWADLEGLQAKRLSTGVEGAGTIRLRKNADVAGVRGEDSQIVAARGDRELRDRKGNRRLENLRYQSALFSSVFEDWP